MSRPLAVLIGLGVLLTALSSAPASAAERPTRFTACAAVSATAPRCYNGGVTYALGQTVYLRGRVTPAHPGYGEVLRQAPGGHRFRVVGTMGVGTDGRIRWSWNPRPRDVNRGEPYLFAFRIPGVGRSNVVEIWIVPEDY